MGINGYFLCILDWRLPLCREAHVSIRGDELTPEEAVEAIVEAAEQKK